MIFGIGCDLCEIKRFENLGENFFRRNFTEDERILLMSKHKNMPQSAAANFAVKEAFSKALGTGVRGFGLKDVEVLRDQLGRPYIKLYGDAADICAKLEISDIFVSISHDGGMAMGYVILWKQTEKC